MYDEEYKQEALLIRQVVSGGLSVLIEPGTEKDWNGNLFPFRVTILRDGEPLDFEEGHKIGLSLGHVFDKIKP